jgi:hypothetical protein
MRPGEARATGALVSVVIPCFNHGHFLGEAILSGLTQTYPHVELIVVDDGSDDDTCDVCQGFPGVVYVRQENRGLSAARNTGIDRSHGSLLVFLDADDRLHPDALKAGVMGLDRHPECMFVAGGYRFIRCDGSLLAEYPPHGVRDNHYVELLRTNFIGMSAVVLYRKELFSAIGGFDVTLGACEDYDLYLRAARNFSIQCYDDVIADYRRHESNMSGNPARMLATACRVLRDQWTHALRRPDAADALRQGIQRVQGLYGGELVEQILADRQRGDDTRAAIGLKIVADFYPEGLQACQAAVREAG